MFFYLIIRFLFVGLVPFIAGRLGKLVPLDPGLLFLKIPHKPRFPNPKDPKRRNLLNKKWHELWLFSFGWGMCMACLFFLCLHFLPNGLAFWGLAFCWILCVLIVIDAQYWLLPDFFTIPLLLLGMCFAFCQPQVGIQMGLIGACGGYFLSVVSVVITRLFCKNPQFGGGDVKMLTALGSWLGMLGLSYTLILSFLLFIVFNIVPIQKKGAYGPALATAALLVFFIMYAK